MNEMERYGLRPQVAAALQADGGMLEEKASLSDVLHVLRKRKGTIVGMTVGTFVLTALFTLLQTPIYEAKTQIMMLGQKGGYGAAGGSLPILGQLMQFSAARSAGTEVEVLQSPTLLERAIVEADSPKILSLRQQIAARDRHRTAFLDVGGTPKTLASLDAADRHDQALIDSEVDRLLDERHRILEDPSGKLAQKDPKIAVDEVKETDLAAISVQDPDRGRARNVANMLTTIYLDQNRRQNSASARNARQFVEAQMDQVKSDLTRAEEKLAQYKERTRSIDISEETKQAVARLAEVGAEQQAAESQYKGLEASVAALRQELQQTPGHLISSTVTTRNPVITELEKQVAGLEVQKAGLLKEYVPGSAEVQGVNAQIAAAQAGIGQEVKRQLGDTSDTLNPVRQALMQQYAQTEAQRLLVHAQAAGLAQAVVLGKAEMRQLPSREMRLAELMRSESVLDKTYTLLNERYQELRVSEAAQLANARIVDVALKPQKPIRPNKTLNLALGFSFGLLLGLSLAFLQEHLDQSVKTPDQMEREFGLPTLGMLGDIRESDDRIISSSRPQTALAEALRMVRSSLHFAAVDGQLQSLLVTSAVPGEGKSTIAANLALVMAQKGLRVMLVDADMRSPRQHRIFSLPNTIGLSSVIVGQSTIEDAAHVHPDSNLMILTSGPMPPNPAELLESARARDLVQQLKASCDMVIFDSPPCTTMVDGASLAAQVEGAVLVVRAGHTPRVAVARACQVLRETGTRLLGTILNRVSAQTDQYYYSYYYRYYYSNDGESESGKKPALARSGSRSAGREKEGR